MAQCDSSLGDEPVIRLFRQRDDRFPRGDYEEVSS